MNYIFIFTEASSSGVALTRSYSLARIFAYMSNNVSDSNLPLKEKELRFSLVSSLADAESLVFNKGEKVQIFMYLGGTKISAKAYNLINSVVTRLSTYEITDMEITLL